MLNDKEKKMYADRKASQEDALLKDAVNRAVKMLNSVLPGKMQAEILPNDGIDAVRYVIAVTDLDFVPGQIPDKGTFTGAGIVTQTEYNADQGANEMTEEEAMEEVVEEEVQGNEIVSVRKRRPRKNK